jgi:hypothetical protein
MHVVMPPSNFAHKTTNIPQVSLWVLYSNKFAQPRPQPIETRSGKASIERRGCYRAMPEIFLNRASIPPIIGKFESAAVSCHVGVNWKRQFRSLPEPLGAQS